MSCEAMKGLDELFAYKNQLMEDLLTSEEVLSLISAEDATEVDGKSLMYTHVFPYEFMPDTTEVAKTFLCCEVDIETVYNKTFLHPLIYVWVFTHTSLLRLPRGGVRMDALSSEIVKVLNGSRMYGLGTLELQSAKRFSPIANYQGRLLKFFAQDFNRLSPSDKQIPVNRRHKTWQ